MIAAAAVVARPHAPTPAWAPVLMLAVGLLLGGGGLALALDYRGFATWHSRFTVDRMWPVHRRITRLPPWRWLPAGVVTRTRQGSIDRQIRLVRVLGALFLVVGAGMTVSAVVTLVTRA